MALKMDALTRRSALTTATLGFGLTIGAERHLSAADWTDAEKANVEVVKSFCAAWPAHDLAKVMSFFADPCTYRVSETQEPSKGRPAVTERIGGFLDRVVEFKILETFAKGPMVFNERIDRFMGGPLRSWHGVGVFFLKDNKIVEWYDYTISLDRG